MNVFKRAKAISIIFIAIFVLYFTNDFNTVNIEKTALIVALAIDKAENEYEITVQIAVPQASDASQGNAESVISAKGSTLYAAVERISEETGWHPRLTFCNLILIGENMLTENLINVIDFFFALV
jgi:spore germination protein KC